MLRPARITRAVDRGGAVLFWIMLIEGNGRTPERHGKLTQRLAAAKRRTTYIIIIWRRYKYEKKKNERAYCRWSSSVIVEFCMWRTPATMQNKYFLLLSFYIILHSNSPYFSVITCSICLILIKSSWVRIDLNIYYFLSNALFHCITIAILTWLLVNIFLIVP